MRASNYLPRFFTVLLGNLVKILSIKLDENDVCYVTVFFNIKGDDVQPIDWSCMDVFVVGSQNGLTIYDNNGTVLDTLRLWDAPTAVKWSNDGKCIQSYKKKTFTFRLYETRIFTSLLLKYTSYRNNRRIIFCPSLSPYFRPFSTMKQMYFSPYSGNNYAT